MNCFLKEWATNNKVNAEANLHGQTDFHRCMNCLISDTSRQTLSSKHESRFLVDLLVNQKYLLPLQRSVMLYIEYGKHKC